MSEKLANRNERGFTLVEIIIVLAIGALVLAGVLFAVQGAQQSRRDTQRKSDLAGMVSAVEQYASNRNGTYPTAAQFAGAMGTNRRDPLTGTTYTYAAIVVPTGTTSAGVLYTPGAAAATSCSGAAMTSPRKFKLEMGLEASGQTACLDTN